MNENKAFYFYSKDADDRTVIIGENLADVLTKLFNSMKSKCINTIEDKLESEKHATTVAQELFFKKIKKYDKVYVYNLYEIISVEDDWLNYADDGSSICLANEEVDHRDSYTVFDVVKLAVSLKLMQLLDFVEEFR